MKRKANFLMREVAGSIVAVPVGAAAREFPGMIRLNEAGKYLWELLDREQTEDSLTEALLGRYEVSVEQARQDVAAFIERIRAVGALEE